MAQNQLYYGDNLAALRDYVKDESVLILRSTANSTLWIWGKGKSKGNYPALANERGALGYRSPRVGITPTQGHPLG